MNDLNSLTSRFGIAGKVSFEMTGELATARVTSLLGSATVALQGAHVMTWQPAGQQPVIWVSKLAKYAPGKSIRGGVPVCWPWFGPHASESTYPGHGFARTVSWALVATNALPDGRIRLEFELEHSDATRVQWPYESVVRNIITVGEELEVELATTNTGKMSFQLGQALHTYFVVGDIRKATVAGLEGCDYLDKVGGGRKRQQGQVSFTQETDRIYLGTHGCCGILDPVMDRTILITSTGSRSTVVWNPWTEKAEKMGDFGDEGPWGMVCVETANAAEDVITLPAGETHRLIAQYRVLAARD
ncbi:MAG TPA: D-hexose-6-phosphate mutarotase [Rhodocyclaceae bacterium]|nr:D-hexose-6-phosphate mutarotase [Rhodocyclaceae bacterium]